MKRAATTAVKVRADTGMCFVSVQEAFWCLVQISEQYLPGYYSPLLVRTPDFKLIAHYKCNDVSVEMIHSFMNKHLHN